MQDVNDILNNNNDNENDENENNLSIYYDNIYMH